DRGGTAARRRVGLVLPKKLAAEKPLVVLIHGLDSGPSYWCDLAPLLEAGGHRVAQFNYPNDQALEDSAGLLADELTSLARKHPGVKLDLVAHSMGALIARAYVEGAQYRGGVRRLIMLAPPNGGSCYARFSHAAELVEHLQLWRCEPQWRWTWLVTDGLGEARRDLTPGSKFLAGLNARPRRRGVQYTIVAGNRSCGWRHTANAMRLASHWLPDVRFCQTAQQTIDRWATRLEGRTGVTDGLVWLSSTRLPGVDDYVLLPADHTTLTCSRGGRPPVAWKVIEARLK
ncbi:MAG TPA: alpha/beta fold hydrolase, partial [Pirellulales bacterium]|nr:alpha/beta fold hydrolase [Pirellulales bacterium]